jgi:hypothetical protein
MVRFCAMVNLSFQPKIFEWAYSNQKPKHKLTG